MILQSESRNNGSKNHELHIYTKNDAHRYDEVIKQPVYSYYVNKKTEFIRKWTDDANILLDVGCGSGVFAISIASFCQTIVGMDISPEMVKRAVCKGRHLQLHNCHFIVGDITQMPFCKRQFDVVFSVNLLHHIGCEDTIFRGLGEEVRCTKKSGRIMIFELNQNSLGWSNSLIPKTFRSFLNLLLSPLGRPVIHNLEQGTRMVSVPAILEGINEVQLVTTKIGGFIPPYCPKSLLKIFMLLERIMETTPILKRYGAHVTVVGKIK